MSEQEVKINYKQIRDEITAAGVRGEPTYALEKKATAIVANEVTRADWLSDLLKLENQVARFLIEVHIDRQGRGKRVLFSDERKDEDLEESARAARKAWFEHRTRPTIHESKWYELALALELATKYELIRLAMRGKYTTAKFKKLGHITAQKRLRGEP